MKWQMGRVRGAMLLFAVAALSAFGQQTQPAKHIREIEAEQPPSVILASPLCQKARESGQRNVYHFLKVEPVSLAPDLKSLMEQSDDVVLAGGVTTFPALAPSGQDVITYFDVKVLRVWKGSDKVGDKITFAIPFANVQCGAAGFSTVSDVQYLNGEIEGSGVLFLRKPREAEAQLTPGLRLAAGGGLQGLYELNIPFSSSMKDMCIGNENLGGPPFTEHMEKCNAFLETSDIPIAIPYTRDPLFKKYNGMAVADFLREVQGTADSLGYASLSGATK